MLNAKSNFCPYKGLIPYSSSDAEFFFGREEDTRLVIANIFAAPLTLFYGVSGVGKSSVLNAGVAHQLDLRNDVVPIVFSEWANDPLQDLKRAVSEKLSQRVAQNSDQPEQSTRLPEFLSLWSNIIGCRLAIIFDQFEDYLNYHPRHTPFASEFALSLIESNSPVSFLISIREDSLARLDRFEGSVPTLFDNYLRLNPLNRTAGQLAIKGPIDEYNKSLAPTEKHFGIDPSLVDVVLEQVRLGELGLGLARGSLQRMEPKTYQLDTVYLQLVMTRLWAEEISEGSHVLRRGTLDKLDGAKSIVRSHLDRVMSGLTLRDKEVAAKVFRYLVSPSGAKVTYPVDELAEWERLDKKELVSILGKLSEGENRILRQVIVSTGLETTARYEIYHDALGPAILDWRARFVREQERRELIKRMEVAKEDAINTSLRKRRQARLLLAGFFFLAVVTILLVGFAVFAYTHKRKAEAAQAEAIQQKDKTQEALKKAERAVSAMKAQDLANKPTKSVMRGHSAPITSAAFNADCTRVITGSEDNTAIIWDVADGNQLVQLTGHSAPVTAVAFSNDGNYAVTASEDETARLWDAKSGGVLGVMTGHQGPLTSVAFSKDGKYIVTGSYDGTARVWLRGMTMSQHTLSGHTGIVFMSEFSPDGTLIVTAGADGTARVWSIDGDLKRVLSSHRKEVTSARFSFDGRRVVTASKDRTARVWDVSTGNSLLLAGHTDNVNDAEFSPDGKYVVTASSDSTARIWPADRRGTPIVLFGHKDKVNSARFSPDGKRIITASDDKTARTWNAEVTHDAELLELNHPARVRMAVFGSDNRTALTFSDDQAAHVWDLTLFGGFRVAGAYIEQISSQVNCPGTVNVNARIDIAEGRGNIRYSFFRTDTKSSITRQIASQPGESTFITYSLRITGEKGASGNLRLDVLEPNRITQNQYFRVQCTNAQTPSPSPPASPTP